MSREYALYDTTLRDGAQCEDMQLTTPDKVKIALRLDEPLPEPAPEDTPEDAPGDAA